MIGRRTISVLAAVTFALGLSTSAFAQNKVLRIGMTASDIPKTHGQPDQAFEGNRLTGLTMYDALTAWDYKTGTRIMPVLATEWAVSADDKTKWVFKLRSGVTFKDGSPFNADAVVWNVQKVLDKTAPQFDPSQVGWTVPRMPTLRSARKIDDMTVEFTTSEPDSFLPLNLVNLFMASPAHWRAKLAAVPADVTDPAQRGAKAWEEFAKDPSGTGAFTLARFVPRERLELVRNDNYWDKSRVPKIDRIVMIPLPDVNSRTAALLAGQVDFVEAPAPDAVASIRARGFTIATSQSAHVWPWQPSLLPGSPWQDKRVRQAANLCVDRNDLVELNGGIAEPAVGMVRANHPWFGKPTFKLRFDGDEGRRLMKEAGYSDSKLATVKVITAIAGSGMMQPLPMNELIQEALRKCYFDVKIEVLEWGTLFTNWREGPQAASARGANTTNVSIATIDPFFALARFADSRMAPPLSNNWGFINDPELDKLTATARTTFDPDARDLALSKVHERLVDEAMFVFFLHEVAPRALSPRITGFSAPNGYYIDWSALDMKPAQ
ncbi:ABC transporter substrate-binding protein [Bradyrhizobium sp.]|uniref:ABC transporter substrate-binding protein n=1 Tax=Bradyrhizobium sp. TaxID=376 RepID=UPI0039E4B05A